MTESGLPRTEERNPLSMDLDLLEGREQVILFLADQQRGFHAHEHNVDDLEIAVDLTTQQRARGGRLVYVGAGTSGRLGVLDAVECKPTFSAKEGEVIGVLAGGEQALVSSVEAAEDSEADGAQQMEALGLSELDMVIGITASGTTPFVHGALKKARELGAKNALVCCSAPPAGTGEYTDCILNLDTGPELLTGSTRLKAGTATKIALNTISTLSFVRLGKTLGNLMVDVQPTNAKLRLRSVRIVQEACEVPEEKARELLESADSRPKVAIVMGLLGVTKDVAEGYLDKHAGHIRKVLTCES